MDTDTLIDRFIEQAKNWEALPDGLSMSEQDYQMVYPNLDVRDESRARIKLRSMINGLGSTIVITKTDGAPKGHVTVWTPATLRQSGPPVSLLARTH